MPKITKSFVNQLKTPGRYKDSDLRGFGVRVSEKLTKVYFVENVIKGTRRAVTVTIGKHGVWTPEKARDKAKQILAQMSEGIDPNKVKRENQAKSEATRQLEVNQKRIILKAIFSEYLSERKLKKNTAYSYQCDINKCLSDWLDMPLAEITTDMVQKRHKEISREHAGQANTVMRILRALFNYSMEVYPDLIKSNPVQRLNNLKLWNKLKPRHQIIHDDKIKPWFDSVMALTDPAARDYLLLLLFTGLRKTEAASLKWSDLDMVNKTLTISETKNGRIHILPLGPFLVDVLKKREATKKKKTEKFVFPGPGQDGYRHDMRERFLEVEELSGVEFTPHTLRRTFTSMAGRLLPEYVVKALTNHLDKTDVTQNHYVWVNVEQLRKPMIQIEKHILKAAERLRVSSKKTLKKVVSLEERLKAK